MSVDRLSRGGAKRHHWPSELLAAEQRVCGPEDEPDLEANGDPFSLTGEEDEAGFDDMPLECGWEDEGESDEDDGADDAADDC